MIVGVTGGTGSGKSEVCRVFESLGGRVIDADRVGHEVLVDPDVIDKLTEAFGPEILDEEGRIVRRVLGRLSFGSEASRRRLTDVVWPAIGARLRKTTGKSLCDRPDRAVVVDAPLLIEWDPPKAFCDTLVVVTAEAETRVARTMSRLGLSREEVEARAVHQLPDEEKVSYADHVIENNGTLAELRTKAHALWSAMHG